MKNFERENFKDCIHHFWVFFWVWAFFSGFGSLFVNIILVVFDVVNKGDIDNLAFAIWKWSYCVGLGTFSLLLVFIYINGLIGLARHNKQAVNYAEEKELKEFISHCKQKKGLR